ECGSSGLCKMTQKVTNDHQNETNSCIDSSCDLNLIAIGGSEPSIDKCSEDCGFEGPAPPPDPLSEGGNFCEFIDGGPCGPILLTTTTVLAQDSTTSGVGCPVTLTATVAPSGATGNVQFY